MRHAIGVDGDEAACGERGEDLRVQVGGVTWRGGKVTEHEAGGPREGGGVAAALVGLAVLGLLVRLLLEARV